MKFTILGSGGAMPTPRPFCQCIACEKARKEGEPYKRNSSSFFINDIATLIDCPEDIGDSLNRRNIKQVDNLFITHWHPDHTFGLRPLLEANFNFLEGKASKQINVYIPKNVYNTLKEKFPSIEYLINVQKTGKLFLIEDGQEIKINDTIIEAIGYTGKNSDIYAYLIKKNDKRILYSPCDTINFSGFNKFLNLDLLVTECGIFSFDKCLTELSFTNLMKMLEEIKPKKTILTHIEEIEINRWGLDYLEKMKKEYHNINFEFGYDGMEIRL